MACRVVHISRKSASAVTPDVGAVAFVGMSIVLSEEKRQQVSYLTTQSRSRKVCGGRWTTG